MARLIPADLGTHYVLVSLTVLATLLLGLGCQWAVFNACAVIIGREVYGAWKRGWRMEREDWIESSRDGLAGLAGGAVVLLGALVGV